MICPKCGTEIKEGYLYCQKCGEEVIMVPDYEVELEEGIEETISEVAEMMADTIVFFSTSYHEKMFEEYKIYIQDKQQEDYFSFKKGDYVIFINELKLSSDKNKEIKIKITDKNNLENIYKIKYNYDQDIIFLLDYDLEEISKAFKYVNINSLTFWRNDRKYINENFSFHENFSFFFNYLLKEKEDIAKYKKIYKELIRTYLEKIKDENIPIDIAISILII